MQHLQHCDATEIEHWHGGEGIEKEKAESVLETSLHGEWMFRAGTGSGGVKGRCGGGSITCQPAKAGQQKF